MKILISSLFAVAVWSGPVLAQDAGLFSGVDVSAGIASGSSDTTDGGALFGGGGVVENVEFGPALGIGGHVGYRFDPTLSAFISYRYESGDVSWDANFPTLGGGSRFAGNAISNTILANLAYDLTLSEATSIELSAGIGIALNTLDGVTETDIGTGTLFADVEDHTRLTPAAQVGVGIRHRLGPEATLGVDASLAYAGSFETGDSRDVSGSVTAINPYEIDNVWRARLTASLQFAF